MSENENVSKAVTEVVLEDRRREELYGFRGPRNHRGQSHKEWLRTLRSLAAVPNPLTRQLRRQKLRAEVWSRWTQYYYEDKDGQQCKNVPKDELGPMPRRIRRAIANALFHNLEKEAKAQADKLRANPEELQALAERFAENTRKAHDEVVKHGG